MNGLYLSHLKKLTFISLVLNGIFIIAIIIILKGINSEPNVIMAAPINAVSFIAKETNTISEPIVIEEPLILSERDVINGHILEISTLYKIDPYLIRSIVQQESEYKPTARNGDCLGLMQVSTRWHSGRALKLGVTDFYDPYGNILLGVDYLAELTTNYKDLSLVLMLYSMDHKVAFKMYAEGKTSGYAKTVLARAEVYRKGG